MISTDVLYRLVLVVAIFSVFFYRFTLYLRKEQREKRITRKRQSISKIYIHTALILSGWAAVLLYIINPTWVGWASFEFPSCLRWAGVIWMIFNTVMILWAHASLGRFFTVDLGVYSGHKLIKHGLYARIRHPIYTILMLDWLAIILITANWFFLIAAIGSILRITNQVAVEESMMSEAFGQEYEEYKQSTGRFLPRLRKRAEEQD